MPSGTGPEAGSGATATYIVTEDRVIFFGGFTTDWIDDVWSLELTPTGGIAMPWPLQTSGSVFSWPVPANVTWVRGELASVSSYAVDVTSTETHATSFTDTAEPAAGSGFYYLVRFDGADGSWQTSPGAEPGRDAALP